MSSLEEASIQASWQKVYDHFQKVHPDYSAWEKAWKPRAIILSASTLVISVSILVFIGSRGVFAGQWWTPFYLIIVIIAGVVPLLLRESRGVKRFREEWQKKNSGASQSPKARL